MDLAIARSLDGENTTVGDLRLAGGDLVWLDDFAEETAQRLTIKPNFFKEEWFLDRRQGIPYYQELFVKDPASRVVRGVFSNMITSDPGVAVLRFLTVSEPDANREATIDYEATLKDGTTLRSSDHGPLIIRVP